MKLRKCDAISPRDAIISSVMYQGINIKLVACINQKRPDPVDSNLKRVFYLPGICRKSDIGIAASFCRERSSYLIQLATLLTFVVSSYFNDLQIPMPIVFKSVLLREL